VLSIGRILGADIDNIQFGIFAGISEQELLRQLVGVPTEMTSAHPLFPIIPTTMN
jgi:hypothetical protein